MEKKISKAVLKRLPIYLSYLKALPEDAPENISATTLAAALNASRFIMVFVLMAFTASHNLSSFCTSMH